MISARPPRDQVDHREVLKDSHGIVRAEHCHRARESDARRTRGRGREHDRGGRDRIVRTVMFPYAENIETDLIS
jgi:hypothetical protein